MKLPILVISALLGASMCAEAQTYQSLQGSTPADTAANVQALIDAEIAAGSSSMTIPAGDYLLADPNTVESPAILEINGASQLTINATGVKFIMTENRRALELNDGVGLTINDLEIDYDPLPFSQGTITAISGKLTDNRQTIDVNIHAGYDTFTHDESKVIVYNPNNGFIKRGSETRWDSYVTTTGPSSVRIETGFRPDTAAVGDYISLTKPFDTAHTISIFNTINSKLDGVKISAANVIALLDRNGSNNKYLNVEISPGVTPAGATIDRLVGGNAGGMIIKHAKIGPQIKFCTIKSIGDDGINIHGEYHPIGAVSGSTINISSRFSDGPEFLVGDTVQVYDRVNGAVSGTATVLSVQASSSVDYDIIMPQYFPDRKGKPEALEIQFKTGWEVTLSQTLPAQVGDALFSPDRAGNGYRVIDNFIQNSRARGILAKASGGIISQNTVDHQAIAGIVVVTEPDTWLETSFADNVLISGNTVKRSGFRLSNKNFEQAGGIVVTAPFATPFNTALHSNVEIRNNTIERITGVNLTIMYASGVDVINNTFVDSHIDPTESGINVGIDPTAIAVVDRADNVWFSGNLVINPGAEWTNNLVQGPDATNITGIPGGL